MRRTAFVAVWSSVVAVLLATTCLAAGAPESPALLPGNYVLTVTLEAAPEHVDMTDLEVKFSAELAAKGDAVTVKLTSEGGDEYVCNGSMEKGTIKFSLSQERDGKAMTMSFEGKVTSKREAGGTFTGVDGDEKGSGKWTLKVKDAKEEKKAGQ